MLAAAVAAAGEQLRSVEVAQVRYRPGRAATASYRARLGGGPALLVAHAGAGMPDGAVLLDGGGTQVGVWRFPNDPVLPGLRHAVDGELLPRLLMRLGVAGPVRHARRRAYRPTRRAVIEVATGRARVFLKVVRPDRVAALRGRHEAVAAAVDAPPVVGADLGLGVLALGEVPGTPLREALRADAPRALPAAADLAALLDGLPPLPGRASGPFQRASHHLELLEAVLPGLAGELGELRAALAPPPAGEPVPVHGDFHPGQVMVRAATAAGLVDVDAAGTGERADDVATMLGYLAAAAADPQSPRAAAGYCAELAGDFGEHVDPGRVAAAIVGFATMPFVTQRPRWPELARRRLARARDWLAAGGPPPV